MVLRVVVVGLRIDSPINFEQIKKNNIMKKIMVMLFGVAVAINAMAVDYTAKAVVTLQSQSGYTCKLTLRQADEYGALSGSEMNMDGRVVAFYALNGATPLQIATATKFTNVKLGLKTDASTNYTLTVSSVAGAQTLKIFDREAADPSNAYFELTEGAVLNFTATGSTEDRFVLNYVPADELEVCFIDNKLQINANPYEEQNIVIKDKDGNNITGSPFAPEFPSQVIDLSTIGAAGDRFTVEFANGARKFVIVKQ